MVSDVSTGSEFQGTTFHLQRTLKNCSLYAVMPSRDKFLVLGQFPEMCLWSLSPLCFAEEDSAWQIFLRIDLKKGKAFPLQAQRVGRGIALLFHDRSTRRWWVVCSMPRPQFTPRKDQIPIVQEPGWAPGPVWTGGKSRPHRDLILDHPACSQS